MITNMPMSAKPSSLERGDHLVTIIKGTLKEILTN